MNIKSVAKLVLAFSARFVEGNAGRNRGSDEEVGQPLPSRLPDLLAL
jgi:hypothetical protein